MKDYKNKSPKEQMQIILELLGTDTLFYVANVTGSIETFNFKYFKALSLAREACNVTSFTISSSSGTVYGRDIILDIEEVILLLRQWEESYKKEKEKQL